MIIAQRVVKKRVLFARLREIARDQHALLVLAVGAKRAKTLLSNIIPKGSARRTDFFR
jgi:hypothetical protein